eukprot:jgi/Chlat1/7119/Chrsp57S09123
MSDGVILDFAGHYYVSVDQFAFGAPLRYMRLDPAQANEGRVEDWDSQLRSRARQYQHVTYNILTSNCHSFVAHCLNNMNYLNQRGRWNAARLAVMMFLRGRFVKLSSFVRSLVPFAVIMGVGVYFGGWQFFIAWAGFVGLIAGWFIIGSWLGFVAS